MNDDYVRQAVLVDIHDGDTITVETDLGYRAKLVMTLRLYGINAPELKTAAGITAREFLKTQIKPGDPVTIKTFKDPGDKYGRWLAVVLTGNVNINDLMVSSGNAVPYLPKGVM